MQSQLVQTRDRDAIGIASSALRSGDSDLRDGRRILDQLRNVFQDRVDDLEEAGASHLDRWVDSGARELDEIRGDLDRHRKKTRSRRSRRHSSKRRRRGKEVVEEDRAEVEHQRVLRRARRRANQRIAFLTHFGTFAATLALILVATRSLRVVTLVALSWGIGVFVHYLWAMAAPALRDRWVSDEVGARSPRAVASERRRVETRSRRSMEDLSASIAHEIRNPITAAKSLVQQMGEDPASDENLEYASIALSELDRVERSISHLLRYARDEEPRLVPISLRSVVLAAVDGLRERARAAGVELFVDFDREGRIRGDREKLRRVIENLISNALDAIAEVDVTRPRIEVLAGENLAGNELWIRVIDNGPGIAIEDRDRIWSPFHTTKEAGTGLGLALSRKTIEAHGGRIELRPDSKQGSEFVISFPKDPALEEPHTGELSDDL
jgi:signal transduction histidine kinase